MYIENNTSIMDGEQNNMQNLPSSATIRTKELPICCYRYTINPEKIMMVWMEAENKRKIKNQKEQEKKEQQIWLYRLKQNKREQRG